MAYGGAVVIALPAENITRDLLGLLLLEFFHGMLLLAKHSVKYFSGANAEKKDAN